MLAVAGLAATLGLIAFPRPDRALWTGDASRPLVDGWASYVEAGSSGTIITPVSRPARIKEVVQDRRKAFRMSVLATDRDRYTNDAQRTELGQGNPTRTFGDGTGRRQMSDGQERWVVERILIPGSVRTGGPGYDFFLVNQFKMDGPGGPAAALALEDDRLMVRRAASRAPDSVGHIDLGRTAVVPRDRWVSIVWHVKWSSTPDGLIEVFAELGDGTGLRRIAGYRGWTLKRAAPGQQPVVHSRIGIYRRAIPGSTTVYFSGYAVATSRAAAEESADL